jgi:hypothetical protein
MMNIATNLMLYMVMYASKCNVVVFFISIVKVKYVQLDKTKMTYVMEADGVLLYIHYY